MNTEIKQDFSYPKEEIDLREILFALGQRKLWILSITLLFLVTSIIFSLFLPDIYRSQTILKPAQQDETSGSPINAVSGLANLAGVNIPSTSFATNTKVAIETMKAFSFFEKSFMPQIQLENLMAYDSWDPINNSNSYDQNIYDSSSSKWVRTISFPKKQVPSAQEAHKEFLDHHLAIEEDIETGLVTVSIDHKSAVIAKKWLEILIKQINFVMREEKKYLSNKSIDFLTQQIAITRYTEIKEALANVVQRETEKLMLAEVDENYVFHTIDPPYAPEEKAKPVRILIALLSLIIGAILACSYVLLSYFNNKTAYKKFKH